MNKTIQVLSALLFVQMLLIGVVNANWDSDNQQVNTPLFSQDIKNSIDEIQITGNGQTLKLRKKDKTWIAESVNNLPVASDRISSVINELSLLKASWPVAKTSAAAERFEVAKNLFDKKVVLKTGGQIRYEFYLGTSPGFKKTHLRLASTSDIYAANLSGHDFSADINDWFDKALLQTSQDLSMSVDINDVSLVKKDTQWQLADQSDNEQVNTEEINKVLAFADELLVSTVLQDDEVAKLKLIEPITTLRLYTGVNQVEYTIYLNEDKAAVKSSLREEWFKIPKYKAEQLQGLSRESFVTEKSVEAGQGETEQAG